MNFPSEVKISKYTDNYIYIVTQAIAYRTKISPNSSSYA